MTYPPRGSGPRSHSTNVGRDVFEASGGHLRIVGQVGVGIGIDNGYLIVNAPIANTVAATEDGIALICGMVRNVAKADASRGCAPWPGTSPRPTHCPDVRHGQERRPGRMRVVMRKDRS
ncbi:D-3-phosphoglycerate dehydrogenase 1, chloroplastic-like [Hordeum vulgare]|nr:D-3-phosphoglycerate dehydrogenase 1, chloroplastic-like [Hordeum vulgare]